jgi:hypothetical protein
MGSGIKDIALEVIVLRDGTAVVCYYDHRLLFIDNGFYLIELLVAGIQICNIPCFIDQASTLGLE